MLFRSTGAFTARASPTRGKLAALAWSTFVVQVSAITAKLWRRGARIRRTEGDGKVSALAARPENRSADPHMGRTRGNCRFEIA